MKNKIEEKALLAHCLKCFDYNPITGVLTNKVQRSGNSKKGAVSSFIHKEYSIITVGSKRYLAHRIVWMMCNGNFPKGYIDHINGNKLDNRIENLRDVTIAVNSQNQFKANSRNKLGVLGVSICSITGKYRASIKANGKLMGLGRFDTIELASQAYLDAKKIYHPQATLTVNRVITTGGKNASEE